MIADADARPGWWVKERSGEEERVGEGDTVKKRDLRWKTGNPVCMNR